MGYKVDFKQLAQDVDIEAVAKLLNLTLSKDHRATCPVCDSERSLQLFIETNTFRCHSAGESGDCIAFYAHVTGTGMYKSALVLQDTIQTPTGARTVPATTPQKTEGRKQPAPPPKKEAFDPKAFASKLAFTDEVQALPISEEDAVRLGVGFYRGRVYFPIRDATGFICGFVGYANGELKMPPQWLASPSNVVKLKRA